jgi:ornithine--oxo-acid transaminase
MDFIKQENRFGAQNYKPLPVVLARGKAEFLFDIHGKKYLDMMSAYSAVSLGHSNKELVSCLHEQAKKLAVTSRAFHHDQMADFLRLLCKISKMDKALPMNSGAEAVETAIKAARRWGYSKKNIPENQAEIIVMNGNFHGRTTTIISFSSEEAYRNGFGPFTPNFKAVEFGNAKALEQAISPRTAAVLLEVMQGEAGIIIPPKGWLSEVQKICKKNNVLLLIDEIQTGLCRTGKWFAYEHFIEKPDGVMVGKALGGGLLPVSAFLASEELMDVFSPGSHGSTFGGNPLACAVAAKALEIMKRDKLALRSKNLGKKMLSEISKIKSPLIREVRGCGLWIGVEFEKKYLPARLVCEHLMEHGILTKETHETVVRLAPPLIISEKSLTHAIKIVEKIVKNLEKKLC